MTPQETAKRLEEAGDRVANANVLISSLYFRDAASELAKAMDAIHAVIKYCDERGNSNV